MGAILVIVIYYTEYFQQAHNPTPLCSRKADLTEIIAEMLRDRDVQSPLDSCRGRSSCAQTGTLS